MHKFIDALVRGLQHAFGGNTYLTTIIASIIPTIEVRGAITVATALGMNVWLAFLISCVSALVVCPILLLCLKPLLARMKKSKRFCKLADAIKRTFVARAEKIENESDREVCEGETAEAVLDEKAALKKKLNRALGVFLFVAVPFPLTGVWTGSAIAAFLDLEYRYSVPAIILGNFTAGLIITVLNIILGKYAPLILLVLFLFSLVGLIAFIVGLALKVKSKKKAP